MSRAAEHNQSWASSPAIRLSMQSNRSRDTHPEVELRRILHHQGMRFRVCARPLPTIRRTADIVFTKAQVAVQVHGCFWHGCPQHYRAPARNSEYWRAKIERNQARDRETEQVLKSAGWLLVVVWEHEDLPTAASVIAAAVRARSSFKNRKASR
jgi:DNA mismatch endonuclease, patch repair protein